MAKMTKQVKKMVEEVNEVLRYNHIKNTNYPLFSNMCWLLSRADCYYGYNYYTIDGRLSGGDNDSCTHIQIYVK